MRRAIAARTPPGQANTSTSAGDTGRNERHSANHPGHTRKTECRRRTTGASQEDDESPGKCDRPEQKPIPNKPHGRNGTVPAGQLDPPHATDGDPIATISGHHATGHSLPATLNFSLRAPKLPGTRRLRLRKRRYRGRDVTSRQSPVAKDDTPTEVETSRPSTPHQGEATHQPATAPDSRTALVPIRQESLQLVRYIY